MPNNDDAILTFWLRDSKRNPVALVATQKVGATIKFAYAIPNPKDKFDHVRGHAIVVGRLTQSKQNAHTVFESTRLTAKQSILQAMATGHLKNVAHGTSKPIPQRVVDVAKMAFELSFAKNQTATETVV